LTLHRAQIPEPILTKLATVDYCWQLHTTQPVNCFHVVYKHFTVK